MYSRALKDIDMQLVTNIRFYDLPNMLGQLTSYIHAYNCQEQLLRDATYVGKIILTCFKRIEALLESKYFANLVKTIKGKNYLSSFHELTSIDRIFLKQMTDVMDKRQVSVEDIAKYLPFAKSTYIVQSEIKKYHYIKKNAYPIYADVDALVIHALVELLYYCHYNQNFVQYLVIGSGDKDYSDMCRMAKEDGILVVSISFMGEGLSKNIFEHSDIIFILFPRLCILKPYRYCLEELTAP